MFGKFMGFLFGVALFSAGLFATRYAYFGIPSETGEVTVVYACLRSDDPEETRARALAAAKAHNRGFQPTAQPARDTGVKVNRGLPARYPTPENQILQNATAVAQLMLTGQVQGWEFEQEFQCKPVWYSFDPSVMMPTF